jgi:hypothetical protein
VPLQVPEVMMRVDDPHGYANTWCTVRERSIRSQS